LLFICISFMTRHGLHFFHVFSSFEKDMFHSFAHFFYWVIEFWGSLVFSAPFIF
jgi:hypothetical protein